MKNILILLLALALLTGAGHALAQGTAFTYQGQLSVNGAPANGNYDLSFTLLDAPTNGNVFGSLTNTATPVTNGLFTAVLDFGGVFSGSNYWLQIAACTNGAGLFTALSPLQPVSPAPYALYAQNAGSAATAVTAGTAASAGSVAGAGITGTVPLAQLPPAVVTNNEAGLTLNGAFAGDGSGLSNITTITFNSSQLSTNPVLNFNGTAQQYSLSNCCFFPTFAGSNGTISIRCHNVMNFTTANLHWLTPSNICPICGTLTFTAFGTNDINAACLTNLFGP